jgi:uncharacterized OB-fold protein
MHCSNTPALQLGHGIEAPRVRNRVFITGARIILDSVDKGINMTLDLKDPLQGVPIREGIFTLPTRPGETPHLIGSRCRKCAQTFFPPRSICSKCFSSQFETVPLSGQGKLYTYTIIGYPAPGLSAPYAVAYIDLQEGVRLFSILTGWDEKKLKLGMDMKMVIEKFKEDERGNVILTYKFRPIQQEVISP